MVRALPAARADCGGLCRCLRPSFPPLSWPSRARAAPDDAARACRSRRPEPPTARATPGRPWKSCAASGRAPRTPPPSSIPTRLSVRVHPGPGGRVHGALLPAEAPGHGARVRAGVSRRASSLPGTTMTRAPGSPPWSTTSTRSGAVPGGRAAARGGPRPRAPARRRATVYHQRRSRAGARSSSRRSIRAASPARTFPCTGRCACACSGALIPPQALGLSDANVSCLVSTATTCGSAPGTAGWRGTRCHRPAATPSPAPRIPRSIEVSPRRVWVGTAEGLAWYGKGTGRWGAEPDFRLRRPQRPGGPRGGGLPVRGHPRRRPVPPGGSGWEQVSDGDLPGRFITCMALEPAVRAAPDRDHERRTGDPGPGHRRHEHPVGDPARLHLGQHHERASRLGRAGSGSAPTETGSPSGPARGTLRRYSKASGEIGDDWILASCETDRGAVFRELRRRGERLPEGRRHLAQVRDLRRACVPRRAGDRLARRRTSFSAPSAAG